MTDALNTVEIGKKLFLLHDEFSHLKKLDAYWASNFPNASKDVAQTIRRSDSEIHNHLLLQVYKELHPFDYLENLIFWDREDMTPYGLMLTKVRYCLGYAGNLTAGQVVSKEQVLALIFAYESYWHFGDDFTLGNNIEFLLKRLPETETWGWPSRKDFKYKEERSQYQWLGHSVVLELKKLARYHRLKSPGMLKIATGRETKPAFRDFRAVHAEITAIAKANAPD